MGLPRTGPIGAGFLDRRGDGIGLGLVVGGLEEEGLTWLLGLPPPPDVPMLLLLY